MFFYIVAIIAGTLFGLGMAVSGMVDPKNVIGFLDFAGDWMPNLAFVMGGGLMVFLPGYFFFIKPRKMPLLADKFCLSNKKNIDKKLIVGAALFGLGWGFAGLCPGPVASSLLAGNKDVIIFFVAMMAGFAIVSYWPAKPVNDQ